MKKYFFIIVFLFSVFILEAYEGLYFTNYVGINAALVLDNLKFQKANPYSTTSQSETSVDAAYDFDIGYTFYKVPISIAVGFELNNWIEPNLRLVLKYNFLADRLLSPYIYLTAHGGLLDLLSYGIHVGGGLDIQITEWYYIGIDVRAGYESNSKIQDKISVNLNASNFSNEIEATLSIGMGFKIPTKKLYDTWKEKQKLKSPENQSVN